MTCIFTKLRIDHLFNFYSINKEKNIDELLFYLSNRNHMNNDDRLYKIDIPIVGLTGGIASGKSSVSKILTEHQFNIICADQLTKNIYKKKETYKFIENNFATAITNHTIDFHKLRNIFFSDSHAKQIIETYIHSHIESEFLKVFNQIVKTKRPNFIVYDAPIIFEKKINFLIDKTVCVYCSKKQQLSRLINRDKIDPNMAQSMIDSQIDIDQKVKMANYTIDNSKEISSLTNNTLNIFSGIVFS